MQFISENQSGTLAIKAGHHEISYAELNKEIQEVAAQLKRLPTGILILNAAPSIEFIIQLLAAFAINKPIALCASGLSEEDMQARLNILGTAMTVDNHGALKTLYQNPDITPHPDLSLILFTSGTTGQVKAVQLSQKNIMANCQAVMNVLGFSKIKEQLLFLPLSYSFGLLGQLLPGLMAGITTQLINQFTEIKTFLETGHIPQMISGVPSHWVALSKMARLYPESAAKILILVSAGAPLSVALRAELKQHFPNATIYNNYGLTEASPRVLTYSSDDPLFSEPYAGYPIGDWKARLSEDNELLIQGSQIMLGYLGEPNDNRLQNGWLHTGDIAEITPSGLIAIKGRRDNQVNIGGEKVNLVEIEHKLCQIEEISEVILLPQEDTIYGIRLVACFDKTTLPASLTEQELTEKIQMHLLPRKLPLTVRFLEQLPRNQHGKLDRKTLLATLL